MKPPHTVTLALTGASGMAYGLRLLECLLAADCRVYLLYSRAAQVVAREETDIELASDPGAAQAALCRHYGAKEGALRVFGHEDWFAPVASGSHSAGAMVICPCTMGTLAAVANGLSDNLIERAADVMLKEKRPLLLVPRETPLSAIHLENMARLARLGVVILPACPGFYHRPRTPADLVDFIVARLLDQLGVEHRLLARWGEM
jgi:4-hydroxy-3-polyprenylbenzoate decarboxylase